MFLVCLHSGSAISALTEDTARSLARELLRVEPGEGLCWVGLRLLVSDVLGNLTSRWAEIRRVQ